MSVSTTAGSDGSAGAGEAEVDEGRIAELGLREPTSAEAVFANFDALKGLVAEEAAATDALGRVTPLLGTALRRAGFFRMTWAKHYGGIEMSMPDQLELVTRFSRIDGGTGWTVAILNASGHYAAHLSEKAYRELYPSIDTPTALSFYPPAKAVQVDGGYRLTEGRWDWGSGGYHADLFVGGALVFDEAGERVMLEEGQQKYLGVWLPPDKTRQADNWQTLGMRGSGSSSYYISEEVFVPEDHVIDYYEAPRPDAPPLYKHLETAFFVLMGVGVGMAQHIVDLTLEAVRTKSGGVAEKVSSQTKAALADAMGELDMMVSGTREMANHVQAVIERGTDVLAPEQIESLMSFGIPVRNAVARVLDICLDVYGSQYIHEGSEMGRIIRDIHVARAHPQFKHNAIRDNRGDRVSVALESPAAITSPLDQAWTITST